MKRFANGVFLGALTAVSALAQDPAAPESLQARVEALRADKLAWREIPWLECPLEALKESREKQKPIITWVFLGSPKDERC
jgi:hypothetical protein